MTVERHAVEVDYLPGHRVWIAGGEIEAYVQSVSISIYGARYFVNWWDSGTRREDWFDVTEIQAEKAKP